MFQTVLADSIYKSAQKESWLGQKLDNEINNWNIQDFLFY